MKREQGIVELEGSFMGREHHMDFNIESGLIAPSLLVLVELKVRVNRHADPTESNVLVDKIGEAVKALYVALGASVDVEIVLAQDASYSLIREFHKRAEGEGKA